MLAAYSVMAGSIAAGLSWVFRTPGTLRQGLIFGATIGVTFGVTMTLFLVAVGPDDRSGHSARRADTNDDKFPEDFSGLNDPEA